MGRLELHMQAVEEQARDDWDDYDVRLPVTAANVVAEAFPPT